VKALIAIAGRPNVGKSTLFTQLTRSRDALVADVPGLTRDWQIGDGRLGQRPFLVIDTGGLVTPTDALHAAVEQQTRRALAGADGIVLLVDAREGLTGADREIADSLRPLGLPVILAVNKSEGLAPALATAEFHALGLGEPSAISAAHGRGLEHLLERIFERLPAIDPEEQARTDTDRIRVTVIGRPNVGKSTLINRMLGEQRVLVADQPGTTRDRIAVPFSRDAVDYLLIDTAGVRRRARVTGHIEKIAVLKTLQALAEAEVAILVVDAREGVTEQDASLLGLAVERGSALVIAVNKWDGLAPEQRDKARRELDLRLAFAEYAPRHFISALHGTGVGDLFASIRAARASAFIQASTAQLTRILEQALAAHQPPLVRGRRIKLRYAHLGGHNPPRIVIHGNQVGEVPPAYLRYLQRAFREALALTGTPVRIDLRQGSNPFAGRRNPLNKRQVEKRRRLLRHVRR